MGGPKKGVSFYIKAKGEVTVYFPEGKTVCQYCRYVRNEDSLKRWKCLLTDEYLLFPFDCVGNLCPLQVEDTYEQSDLCGR